MYTQTFIIEGKVIGRSKRKDVLIHQSYFPPHSIMIFCEQCGHVFARCPVVHDVTGKVMRWQSFNAICKRCEPIHSFQLPGSVWLVWNTELINSLPNEVLQQELLLTLSKEEYYGKARAECAEYPETCSG